MWTDVGWLSLSTSGDVLQRHLFFTGKHYEGKIAELLLREIREGATFYDVGGHVGYFSLLAARQVGPKGRVIAFEPQSRLAAAITKSLQLNGIHWVKVENVAVSCKSGQMVLFLPEDTGRTSASNALISADSTITVETTSLSDYCQKAGRPDWIKIDIEGGEWNALIGMKEVLSTPPKPRLIIEVHPIQLIALGSSPEKLVAYLRKHEYQLRWINLKKGIVNLPENLSYHTTWHLLATP